MEGVNMKKFEIGKRYYESGVTYEIIKKTAKTVTYKAIQHAGKINERVLEQKTAKLQIWGEKEVFCVRSRTIEAA
jgi:hypothetical protein